MEEGDLPVDNNVELKFVLKQSLPVHTPIYLFLSCFFMLRFPIHIRLSRLLLRQLGLRHFGYRGMQLRWTLCFWYGFG